MQTPRKSNGIASPIDMQKHAAIEMPLLKNMAAPGGLHSTYVLLFFFLLSLFCVLSPHIYTLCDKSLATVLQTEVVRKECERNQGASNFSLGARAHLAGVLRLLGMGPQFMAIRAMRQCNAT
mmetsp:Transcript_14993/g.40210  ORF Transcript_14993/g.40210 Transcript_14993/m.40210 type:complete len:122 (-) Transcript_14993:148-513(-)